MENNLGNNPLAAIASNVFNPETKEAVFKEPKPTAPSEMPQTLRDIVTTKLKDFFYEGYYVDTEKSPEDFVTDFNALLQETGAVVSGGFILWALGLYPADEFQRGPFLPSQPDLDIYVPCKNVVKLYSKLGLWMETTDVLCYKQSKYCSSFLKRNGIRRVYTFEKYVTGPLRRDGMGAHRMKMKSMDIMSVRNARDVKEVVKNFDLTFTMNWYDGDKLYSMYPKHLDHKIGLLQGDYVKMFLTGNRFLIKRMKKYTKKRGFDVRLDPEEVAKHTIAGSGDLGKLFCQLEKSPRNDAFYTNWAIKALLEFMLTKKYKCSKTKDFSVFVGFKYWGDDVPLYGDDGYDSDEFELKALNDPAKDAVKEKFVEIAAVNAIKHDPTLEDLTPEEKFWHLVTRCISYFYSNSADKANPFINNWGYVRTNQDNATLATTEAKLQEILNSPEIKRCLDALKGLFVRIDMDLVTLEDLQVYDFHAHKSDKGASIATINGLLTNNRTIGNKDEIPCYLPPEECGRYLTRNDVRPFANPEIFNQFVSYRPPIQQIALGALTDWGVILRNEARSTNTWGAINKQTMCPFCLRQEERNGGCAYMVHAHEGTYDPKKMPYCDRTEQVKELWQKYKDYQKRLPLTAYGTEEGLEYCAICGRPCHGHSHFDLANPGQIIVNLDYGKCAGGGRAELVARMLAARAVLKAHKDDAEPVNAEIRREAAFAADAAPLDAALMARARAILAQEAAARKFNNDGVNEYSATGWPPGGGPPPPPGGPRRGGPGGDEEVKVAEEGDEIVVPEVVPELLTNEQIADDIHLELLAIIGPPPEPPAGQDRLAWYRALRKYLDYTEYEYEDVLEGWTPETPLPQLNEEGRRITIDLMRNSIAILLGIEAVLVPTPPEGQDPIAWYEALRKYLEEIVPGQRQIPAGWNPGMAHPQPAAPAPLPAGVVVPPVGNLPRAPPLPPALAAALALPAPALAPAFAGPPQNWAAGFNAANFANNNAMPNNIQGGRRYTRGRRKSAMKKRLRTQRNSRR